MQKNEINSVLDRLFSAKYANKATIADNAVLELAYRIAYPFAILLHRAKLSPNNITAMSVFAAALSFCFLIFDAGWFWYCAFWSAAVLFDFCDGTVARMTNRISKTAFRFDHSSDLLKINLVILGVGLRYNEYVLWSLALSSSFMFMFYTVLNHELGSSLKILKNQWEGADEKSSPTQSRVRYRERYRIIAWLVKYDFLVKLYRNIYSAVLTISGHTLLLFLFFPFGRDAAIIILSYLIVVSVLGITKCVSTLLKIQR